MYLELLITVLLIKEKLLLSGKISMLKLFLQFVVATMISSF